MSKSEIICWKSLIVRRINTKRVVQKGASTPPRAPGSPRAVAGEQRQHLHVRVAAALGCGDEEDEGGGAVLGTPVDPVGGSPEDELLQVLKTPRDWA